jgi:hypothetical protein
LPSLAPTKKALPRGFAWQCCLFQSWLANGPRGQFD